MKTRLMRLSGVGILAMLLLFTFSSNVEAQKVEKLIIYENFGGPDAGSSEEGITPTKWPAVHSDSNEYSGWYATMQKMDNKNSTVLVPQFYGNKTFHIDSVIKYKDGGIGSLDITVNTNKSWYRSIPFLNGYTTAGTAASTTLDFKFWGATVLPELSSWVSYTPYALDTVKNQIDEQGYIYFGKDIPEEDRPVLTLPNSLFDYLSDISSLEIMFSGSRVGKNNTLSVRIDEVTSTGTFVETTYRTYSATIEPRTVTVPINKDYCRIYIQGWGDANNGNVTDLALSNGNTFADTSYTYNYNAIAGTKPNGDPSNGQTANPGLSIHMIKMYAMMDGAGYTITTSGDVTGTTTGIAHGSTATLTAAATKGGKNFMGWNIEGKNNLSEVVNPLNIEITEDITIMPVYVGDEVELPVVNENFTNWTQKGNTLPEKNNLLDYNQGSPNETVWSGSVKVPFRYGFTSNGKDSIEITLKACNVIPQYGLFTHNLPGWQEKLGFIAFMGPNADKGYVSVESATNITKAVVNVSSYDQPQPDRACAILVNDVLVRNKTLRTLYAEDITIKNESVASGFQLQVGPGNQARCEYLTPEAENADIFTGVSAAAVAMHNLQLFAKVTVPDLTYNKLTILDAEDGMVTGITPLAGNSTNHFLTGTEVTVTASPDLGMGFLGWFDGSDGLVSMQNPYKFEINAATTLKPKFGQTPSYINVVPNVKGTIVTDIEPVATVGDVREFVGGVPLLVTAEPVFGFEFAKFIKDDVEFTTNPLQLSNIDMAANGTIKLEVEYDSIIATNFVAVFNNAAYSDVVFSPEPVDPVTVDGDSIFAEYPVGSTIEVTVNPKYSYTFTGWEDGMDVGADDLTSNPLTITLDTDKHIANIVDELSKVLLIVNQGVNGTIEISDEHKDGTSEALGLWPEGYKVNISSEGDLGYVLSSLGSDVSFELISDKEATVLMKDDTVTLAPEFTQIAEGVVLAVNENFQDATQWPQIEGSVSNVPGAIDFLKLEADWDPTTYNDDLEGLLTLLAEYRVWGSSANDKSDGPSGTKDPMTTLDLVYNKATTTTELSIGSSTDKVNVTIANFSPCNDCLIGKAVKGGSVSNYYLGHVTPGMIALRSPEVEERDAEKLPAFIEGDSVGVMVIGGLAYVEKVQVGYVAGTGQFSPGVFYTIDDVEIVSSDGLFGDVFGNLYAIGQVERPDKTPYNNEYGWGSAQEGMIMDKNMYIAEEDVPETKVVITAGYREGGGTYTYSNVYIHDLKVWGSPMTSIGIKDLFGENELSNSSFSMLGFTNDLKVDIEEPVKAIVIYNMNGVAVKVIRNLDTNVIDLGELTPGVYAAHAYGRSGKMYKGTFGKLAQ